MVEGLNVTSEEVLEMFRSALADMVEVGRRERVEVGRRERNELRKQIRAEVRSDVYDAIKENIEVDMSDIAWLCATGVKPDTVNRLSSSYSELLKDCDKMFEYLENGSIML